MNTKDNLTFDDTIQWATNESIRQSTKIKGIPIFYIVIGSVIVLILTILIIYIFSQDSNEKIKALEIMKNQYESYSYTEEDEYIVPDKYFPINNDLINPLSNTS